MKDNTLHRITLSDFLWRLRELRAFTLHPKADVLKKFLEICRRQQIEPEAVMSELMEEYVEMHTAGAGTLRRSP